MRKWNLPLTYEPKIQPVMDGKIRQTIRTGRKFSIGDLVAFHGWQGKPRRSPWSFRTGYFLLTMVIPVEIKSYGIIYRDMDGDNPKTVIWELCDHLATKDGIVPPTGEALRDILVNKNKIPDCGVKAQIIRW